MPAAAGNGSFKGGNYVGTLANDGVGLAPFHDFDSKVPASLKAELDAGQGGHHQRQSIKPSRPRAQRIRVTGVTCGERGGASAAPPHISRSASWITEGSRGVRRWKL